MSLVGILHDVALLVKCFFLFLQEGGTPALAVNRQLFKTAELRTACFIRLAWQD